MPYPITMSAIVRLLVSIRPYAQTACHIPSQYQPLLVSSLVSDPTHQLHTVSHPSISHHSSPRWCQTLRTLCMPFPIPTSASARLLARITPYTPPACHIASLHQPLLVSSLISDPTHPLHAISHPNMSQCSSPRSYQTLRTCCMPYPIPMSAIALLLARMKPYAQTACHIPSLYQPLFVCSLVSDPTHPLHAISPPNVSHRLSPRSYQTLRTD
jgi:hypothetical protein